MFKHIFVPTDTPAHLWITLGPRARGLEVVAVRSRVGGWGYAWFGVRVGQPYRAAGGVSLTAGLSPVLSSPFVPALHSGARGPSAHQPRRMRCQLVQGRVDPARTPRQGGSSPMPATESRSRVGR